jgi:hypothetical protein
MSATPEALQASRSNRLKSIVAVSGNAGGSFELRRSPWGPSVEGRGYAPRIPVEGNRGAVSAM